MDSLTSRRSTTQELGEDGVLQPRTRAARGAAYASARVAAKAGLVRAADLDTDGEDGPDQIWILPSDQGH